MNVYEKLMEVQSKLKAPKGQFNSFGNYKYRSCEDILESLKPLLAEVKAVLNLTDTIELIGERFYVKATAIFIDAEKGEKVEVTALAREDATKKGMDLAQVTGSVSSYARKYALNGLFCIDDTKDSDATNTHGKDEESHQEEPKLSEKQVARAIAIAKSKGIDLATIKKSITKDYKKTEIADLNKREYEELCTRLENAEAKK